MDTTVGFLIGVILIAVALFYVIRWLIRAREDYGGTRIVTCPETARPANVEVDAVHAALTSTFGNPDIRLQTCTRWPLRENCGQECLIDLNVAPADCLVNSVLMKWYSGRKCLHCGVAFEEVNWTDHRPALRSPDGDLRKWSEVSVAEVATVLNTYSPVCWNCYIAQSFVSEHPELVVFRPWKSDMDQHERRL